MIILKNSIKRYAYSKKQMRKESVPYQSVDFPLCK